MDHVTVPDRPRHLVDWPAVLVEVECSLCPRRGRYRVARLAERYGAAVPLDRLLALIAEDCTLMKPGEKSRRYEARCGIRYVVADAGPLPADAPARAGGQVRRQGIGAVSATCLGLWQGQPCRHTATLPLDRLGASDETGILDLCRSLRLVCSRCGGRKMHVVPLWPGVRRKRAESIRAVSDQVGSSAS